MHPSIINKSPLVNKTIYRLFHQDRYYLMRPSLLGFARIESNERIDRISMLEILQNGARIY